jgi:AAA domain
MDSTPNTCLPEREDVATLPIGLGYFSQPTEPSPEVIKELLREGQLGAIAGPFGMGKTPMIQDITVCAVRGLPWCARQVSKRPVILFDFESAGSTYRLNIQKTCERYGVAYPSVPDELEPYLQNDQTPSDFSTTLLEVLTKPAEDRFKFLEECLRRKPSALMIIDPLSMFFPGCDTNKSAAVLQIFSRLKRILSKHPQAAMLCSFNLRKRDRKRDSYPSLLSEPRTWLEEIAGSLDIVNRSDVRLGIDALDDDLKVVNGMRRGEEIEPMLIRSVTLSDDPAVYAGFESVTASETCLLQSLTTTQLGYWQALPNKYRFEDVADKTVPRSSLSRLHKRLKSLGVLREGNGTFQKVSGMKVLD